MLGSPRGQDTKGQQKKGRRARGKYLNVGKIREKEELEEAPSRNGEQTKRGEDPRKSPRKVQQRSCGKDHWIKEGKVQ